MEGEAKTLMAAVPAADTLQATKAEPAPTPARVKCELFSPATRGQCDLHYNDQYEAATQQVPYESQQTFLDSMQDGQEANGPKTPSPGKAQRRTPKKQKTDHEAQEKMPPSKADEQKTPNKAEEQKTPNKAEEQKTLDKAEKQKTPDKAEKQKTPNKAEDQKTPNKAEVQKTPKATTPLSGSIEGTPKSAGSMLGKRRRLSKSPDPLNEVPKSDAPCLQIQICEAVSV